MLGKSYFPFQSSNFQPSPPYHYAYPPIHPSGARDIFVRDMSYFPSRASRRWNRAFTPEPSPSFKDWPSHESIFNNRLQGKAMLKEKYPDALNYLHQGHRIIQPWFEIYTSDSVPYDILQSDFKKKTEMRKVLTNFVAARYHELPPLVFEKQEDKDKNSYSMKWNHDTVYQYIITVKS